MTAYYLDASVVLRVVLGQPGALAEWNQVDVGVSSALMEVECLRTLDRLRLAVGMGGEEIAVRREAVYRLAEEMELVTPGAPVLARASQPFPTPLGTLDAVHLASALLWQEIRQEALVFATHDRALATAARASGLRVVGI
ncbi:MAG TPA: type II toxin-antitoxin system VapC family toxin [Longimicrobiales bacterium]|nr:type II toxin-antitoxin system VapC family toxin [Longimicrobiales bacterium]